ncbi:hypothetical protein V6N13_140627 [Hibiscus sabdariffa]
MSNINHPNVKSGIAYSDFKILEKDLGKDLIKVGRFSVPPGLVPIARKIDERHGDIAKPSSQSDCAANPSFILLCAQSKRWLIHSSTKSTRPKSCCGEMQLTAPSTSDSKWVSPLINSRELLGHISI